MRHRIDVSILKRGNYLKRQCVCVCCKYALSFIIRTIRVGASFDGSGVEFRKPFLSMVKSIGPSRSLHGWFSDLSTSGVDKIGKSGIVSEDDPKLSTAVSMRDSKSP